MVGEQLPEAEGAVEDAGAPHREQKETEVVERAGYLLGVCDREQPPRQEKGAQADCDPRAGEIEKQTCKTRGGELAGIGK